MNFTQLFDAFVIWGSPRKGKRQDEPQKEDASEDEYKFFPLC